jgi:hypothetical protein
MARQSGNPTRLTLTQAGNLQAAPVTSDGRRLEASPEPSSRDPPPVEPKNDLIGQTSVVSSMGCSDGHMLGLYKPCCSLDDGRGSWLLHPVPRACLQ